MLAHVLLVVCSFSWTQSAFGHKTEKSVAECPDIVKSTKCNNVKHQCRVDSDCARDYNCCSNGCFQACLRQDPPSVIDWDDDPFQRANTGLWRKNGTNKDEFHPMRVCSTSIISPPAAPMTCDLGFVCRIQDPGDPLLGVSNRGICVPHNRLHHRQYVTSNDGSIANSTFQEKSTVETVYLPGGCALTKEQYESLQDFQHLPYVINCTCIDSSVDCLLENTKVKERNFTFDL